MHSPIPSPASTRGYKITTLIASAVCAAAVVAALVLIFTGDSSDDNPIEPAAVTAPNPTLKGRATELACVLIAVDSTDLDGYFARARAATTGDARQQIDKSEGMFRAQTRQTGQRVDCTVTGLGVISETGARAEILAATDGRSQDGTVNSMRMRYTLVRQDGTWLISKAVPLTPVGVR